jgi:hypothetical protein
MSQKDLGAGFIRNHQSSCKILNQILYNFHSKSVYYLLPAAQGNSSKWIPKLFNICIWLILRTILFNFHSKSVYIKPATQGNLSKWNPKLFRIFLFNFENNSVQFPLEECFYYM